MKVSELLNEKTWTTEAYARNAAGHVVNVDHEEATQWCLIGAINKCYSGDKIYDAYNKVYALLGNNYYVKFNDTHTWPEVKALVEQAGI